MNSTLVFQCQSALILSLMIFGYFKRTNRDLHKKIMTSAMVWDVILILQIELSRKAIKKASEVMMNVDTGWLMIHIFLAFTCVVLYGFMFHSGNKVIKGETSYLKRHKILGYSTLTTRVLVFITSFLIHIKS